MPPTYEFENEEHGLKAVLPFSVRERPDVIVLRRRTVPSRITVGVGNKPPTMSDKLTAGYRALEARGSLRTTKPGQLSPAVIKRALQSPDPA